MAKLFVEVVVGICYRARLKSLVGSLTEHTAHSSIEQRLYLRLDIELLAIDVSKCPYKQFLVKLQADGRCLVRIEVNVIDYQSK